MDDAYRSWLAALLPTFFGPIPDAEARRLAARFRLVRLASGDVLYREGERCDSMDVVLAGRLEVRVGSGRTAGRLETGDCVGEIAVLTGGTRSATVLAVRRAVLARLAKDDFDRLVEARPEAGMRIARLAIQRLTLLERASSAERQVRNVALVPLDEDVPIAELGRRLEIALLRFGSAARIDRRTALDRLGGASQASEAALERLLDEIESSRRFVIYQADAGASDDWTLTCLGQADRVLFVAWADASPASRPIERALREARPPLPAGRDLVLLHPGRRAVPAGTASWLAGRRADRHFHVAWEGRRGVQRLARFLAGRAVSLVLSGGGARGFAHIGAIRAIREAGIPIDAAGGSSIGAIIAACVALDWQDERILQSIKRAFVDERPLNDFTLPVFALLRGEKVSEALQRWFGDVDIVDMWAPYFCVTSNLSRSARSVHRAGSLWKATRASVSLPGILPPFVYDGELHVDGGILDNLPVDVMKSTIGGRTIAIDASVGREYTVAREAFPSPFEHLRSRLLPGTAEPGFPTLGSLLVKATTLAGSSAASSSQADLYLNPPTREFDLLDWGRIFELVELGHRYTRERLPAWIAANPESVQPDELLEFRSPA